MTQKKEASFVKGALILAIASVMVKVIGAVFRIPLTNLVGKYTMGLYSIAYRYYSILLTIATAGIPIAISKMISESRALGRPRETKKIFRTAISLCIGIGAVGMIALIVLARPLALATKDPNASVSIIALAPAVLFMAVTAGFRGYFQGHENMVPTALSQIIEALSRLLIGLAFAWILLAYGFEEKFVSAGIILGITTGTVLTILLMLGFLAYFRKKGAAQKQETLETRKSSELLSALLKIAIPVTVGSLVMNLTSTIDMFLITDRLASLGYNNKQTTGLFGIYENYALPLFNLIPSIIISLNVSVTPTISAAHAVGDREKLHKTLLSALRIVIIITLPASIGISVLSKPILSILYPLQAADVATAAPVLSILGIASFFLCASSLTSTSMQALGHATLPLITMLCGAVVKVLANYFLIAIPGVELSGAAVGTVLCYVLITVLNMIFLARLVKFKPKFVATYLRPVISSLIMGATVFGVYRIALPFVGNLVAVVASIGVGVVVYFVAMLVSKGINEDDVKGLPKGEKIAKILFKK